MHNIILKNKTLIKAYKTGKTIFKWLNRHFYIVSIISLFARWRKSNVYYIIKYLMKIVLVINIVITSGIFFSVADLITPFYIIESFYKDLFGPYLELIYNYIKELYESIINIGDKTEKKFIKNYLTKDSIVNSEVIEPVVESTEETKYSITRTILVGASVALILYFFFVLPPAPPTGGESNYLKEFNIFNKTLLEVKIYFRDLFKNIDLLSNHERDLSNTIAKGKGPDYDPYSPANTPDQITPKASTSSVKLDDIRTSRTTLDELKNIPTISTESNNNPLTIYNPPSLVNKAVQTNINGFTVSKMVESINILNDVLDEENANTIRNFANDKVKTITDLPINKNSTSNLLKSTQLLENKNDD